MILSLRNKTLNIKRIMCRINHALVYVTVYCVNEISLNVGANYIASSFFDPRTERVSAFVFLSAPQYVVRTI